MSYYVDKFRLGNKSILVKDSEARSDIDILNSTRTRKAENLYTGDTILPKYLGDYIVADTYQPGSVCEVSDRYYCIDSFTIAVQLANHNNLGRVRIFDKLSNSKVSEKEIVTGHANSVCFYNNHFYVAPVFDCSTGVQQNASYIYEYDSSFSNMRIINTPRVFFAVSVDPVDNTMYCFSGTYIYKFDGSTFEQYSQMVSEDFNDNLRNQDVAVYNGVYYWSAPEGLMVTGKIMEGTTPVYGSLNMGFIDYQNRFHLGEYEGMEFNAKGQLICLNYTTLYYEKNAFILEIPTAGSVISERVAYSTRPYQSVMNVNVHPDVLFLPISELRTVQQMLSLVVPPSELQINGTLDEPYIVHIFGDVYINILDTWNVSSIVVDTGNVVLRTETQDTAVITFNRTDYCISCKRGGRITIGNPFNFTADNLVSDVNNNFIDIGTSTPLVVLNKLPSLENKVLKLGETVIESRGVYFGQTQL